MPTADQSIRAEANTKRCTAARTDIRPRERAMVIAVRGCNHGPRHDPARPYANVQAQSIHMPCVILAWPGIRAEAAAQSLMRRDDQTQTRGGPAGQCSDLGAHILLC